MQAKKAICGAKPPSRAVAICSGIAIAANVSPAIRSPGREWDVSERNRGHALRARESCGMVLKSPESWQLAIRLQHFRIGRRQMQLLYIRRHCFAEPVIGPRFARTRGLAMTEDISVLRISRVVSVPAAVVVIVAAAAAAHSHADPDTNSDALHDGAGRRAAIRWRGALIDHYIRGRPALPGRRVDDLALRRSVVDALFDHGRDRRIDRRRRCRRRRA